MNNLSIFNAILTNDWNKYWWLCNNTAREYNILINLFTWHFVHLSLQYKPMIATYIGDNKIIQLVSIIYLLLYLNDIKCIHSFLQYQLMIGTYIGDYATIQHMSTIYLLIYLLDILSIYFFNINQWLQHILVIIRQYRKWV